MDSSSWRTSIIRPPSRSSSPATSSRSMPFMYIGRGLDKSALHLARRDRSEIGLLGYWNSSSPAGDLSRFADGSIDMIYSWITLQHVRPRYARQYIREFLRVLARVTRPHVLQ